MMENPFDQRLPHRHGHGVLTTRFVRKWAETGARIRRWAKRVQKRLAWKKALSGEEK